MPQASELRHLHFCNRARSIASPLNSFFEGAWPIYALRLDEMDMLARSFALWKGRENATMSNKRHPGE